MLGLELFMAGDGPLEADTLGWGGEVHPAKTALAPGREPSVRLG